MRISTTPSGKLCENNKINDMWIHTGSIAQTTFGLSLWKSWFNECLNHKNPSSKRGSSITNKVKIENWTCLVEGLNVAYELFQLQWMAMTLHKTCQLRNKVNWIRYAQKIQTNLLRKNSKGKLGHLLGNEL